MKNVKKTLPEARCLRCGRCCHGLKDDGSTAACRFLKFLITGHAFCRIYKNRLGATTGWKFNGKEAKCVMRNDCSYNYKGCPSNIIASNTDKKILEVGY